MNVKEYLAQIQKLKAVIDQKQQEIRYINDMTGSISSPSLGGISNSSKNTSPAFIHDLERKEALTEDIHEINKKIELISEDINNSISKVDDIRERSILMYRYILCLPWKDIALKIGYTERWTYSLYEKALNSFEKKNSVLFSSNSS